MSRRQVISMLEFLRTGKLAGLAPGCTTDDVIRVLGKPDYEYEDFGVKNVSNFRYESLEIWFHTQTRVVYRITLQRFRSFWMPKSSHSFRQGIPQITRAKIDAWIIRQGLDLETMKRFLKTANLKYVQRRWESGVDQLDLESGVRLLFDPPDATYRPGLGFIYVKDSELMRQISSHYGREQEHAIVEP